MNIQRIFTTPFNTAITTTCILGVATLCAAMLFAISPVLAVVIIFSAIALLVFIVKPCSAYVLLILLYHFSYLTFIIRFPWQENNSYTYTPSEVFLAIMLLLWFVSRSINAVAPYSRTACDLPLLLFFGLALLSLVWSHDFNRGTEQIMRLFFGSIGSFVLSSSIINTHRSINKIIWLIIILGIMNSIICFFSLYSYPDYTNFILYKTKEFKIDFTFNDCLLVGKRGHGFGHPLATAVWLNIAFILFFGSLITTKGNRKILIGLIMFIMLMALLTTLSKGPVLGLIGGMVFLISFIKPLKRFFFLSIIVLIITIFMSFIFANIVELKKISGVTAHQMTFSDDMSSTSSRTRWWSTSIRKSLESYGFGVGIGGIKKYLQPSGTPHPHNVYVTTFGELGFIGLGLLLLIYVVAFKVYLEALVHCKSEYYRRILLTYMGGFVMILITIATDFTYIHDIIWWYIGFGFALAKFAKEAPPGYMEENIPFFKDGKSICATVK